MTTVESNTLNTRAHTVLLRLEMTAWGSTQAWNASGGGSGKPDDKVVFQVIRSEEAPHLRYRRRYSQCHTDTSRLAVIIDAEAELKAIIRREAPLPTDDIPIEVLVLEDCEGLDPLVVASRLNVHQAFVRRTRARKNRDPESGRSLIATPGLSATERRERAAEMKGRGLSLKQIGWHLGVDAATISRDLAS